MSHGLFYRSFYYFSGPWTRQLRFCLWRVRKLSDLIKNILICVQKMNKGLTVLERQINDIIIIFGWTIPLILPWVSLLIWSVMMSVWKIIGDCLEWTLQVDRLWNSKVHKRSKQRLSLFLSLSEQTVTFNWTIHTSIFIPSSHRKSKHLSLPPSRRGRMSELREREGKWANRSEMEGFSEWWGDRFLDWLDRGTVRWL